MSFFAELKRRRVVRVAIGYAISAWVLVQVADILLPTFDAPEWLLRAVVAVAFLGFPLTVVLAWVFDLSGRRIVITRGRGFTLPEWSKAVVAVPAIAMVLVSGWWVWSGYVAEKKSSVHPTDLGDRIPIVAVSAIRNVTDNPRLDWYGEGLANLIRDNLSRSRYLRVVSSSKWHAITGTSNDATEQVRIALAEGIDFIVEGEIFNTPDGISIISRVNDLNGGLTLASTQLTGLTSESLITAAVPAASHVRQALNVPRQEQVGMFAANFAAQNLAAYESYVAGLGFFENYQYEEALKAFSTALDLAPNYAIARYRLAQIQAVAGETNAAIANLERALGEEQLQDRERRYIEAAYALFKRDYKKAIELYEALTEEYPFEFEARYQLAQCYWGDYRPDLAIREMERLSVEEPHIQDVWSSLGYWLMQMKRLEEAQPAIEKFAKLAPDNPNAHTLLGDLLRYQSDFGPAIDQYQKALSIDPQMRGVANSLATIRYLRGDLQQATKDFAEIAADESLFPSDRLDAAFELASLIAARGNFRAAAGVLEKFTDLIKEEGIREAKALVMMGLYEQEMGHDGSATELIGRSIQLSPGVPTRYLFARGLVELQREQFDRAMITASEIADHALPPENPDRTEEKAAAYLRGGALIGLGELEDARKYLEQAIRLEGYPYSIYRLGLARLLFLQGKTDIALAEIAGATAIDPIDPRLDLEFERVQSMVLVAKIHRVEGDIESARNVAGHFLDRFDQADVQHPLVVEAREIMIEPDLAD